MIKHFQTIVFIITLVFVYSTHGFTQTDTLVLTLEDAIHIAQQQSPDALIAKHKFRSSYWHYRSFKAEYLPQLNFSASNLPNYYSGYRKIPVPDGPDVWQYNETANFSMELSIDQRIGPTGGSVFLRSNLNRLDNIYSDSTNTSFQSTPVVIGYNQPLFQYNKHRWDKKIEPLKYEQAKRTYLEDVEQVAITGVNHFFSLLLAQIEKDIAIKNMHNYDTLYKIAVGRFNLGKIAENELLQLELNLLQAELSVDQSELTLENMMFQLKSYLRIPESGTIILIPPIETLHKDIIAAQAIGEAKKNTSTYLEFDERLIAADSEVRKAKSEGRFDANIYIEYGVTQSADKLTNVYDNPKDQRQLTFGVNVPILDWGVAKGQIKMAQSNQELELTAVEQEIIDFDQNIFLEVMQFNMQEDQIRIAAKSDTVAQKRFDITQKRYMIGLINDVLELDKAQIDNDNAKKSYYVALRTFWRNYYQIRKLTLYDFFEEKMLIFDIRDVM